MTRVNEPLSSLPCTMSKLPPALLYLTIYNPTLLPTGPVDKDDEDAEEQAHILFYTARERAVSRDKMLRQVGLAKALVNFSRCASKVCWHLRRCISEAKLACISLVFGVCMTVCLPKRRPARTFIRSLDG